MNGPFKAKATSSQQSLRNKATASTEGKDEIWMVAPKHYLTMPFKLIALKVVKQSNMGACQKNNIFLGIFPKSPDPPPYPPFGKSCLQFYFSVLEIGQQMALPLQFFFQKVLFHENL